MKFENINPLANFGIFGQKRIIFDLTFIFRNNNLRRNLPERTFTERSKR
ncbi:MAG: hypothetical protein ACOY90_12395 [Candidatus Zhuqueibacterota bacterium]